MKKCDDRQLQLYLDGELSWAEASRVEAHVATCERCGAALTSYSTLGRAASQLQTPEWDEVSVLWNVRARIEREKPQTLDWWPRLWQQRRVWAGALAIMLIASTGFLAYKRQDYHRATAHYATAMVQDHYSTRMGHFPPVPERMVR